MYKVIKKHSRIQLTDSAKEWIVYGICILCLALFASAAYGKVVDHETFSEGLSKVSFIKGTAIYIAWFVPVAELLVVALLIIPGTQRLGFYCFITLIAVFTGYIVAMMLWAENLPCHCNLIIEKLSWEGHIWFNAGFMALAVFALWLGRAKGYKKQIR
jgi:hypothetical protein